MSLSWSKCFVLIVIAASLSVLLSCGHAQQLVGITIEPSEEDFGDTHTQVFQDAGLNVQLRALGTYIHPPVTKDITNDVTWVSNSPGIATVSDTGLLTAAGIDCGGALVSATLKTNHSAGNISSSGSIITGTMTANVVCPTP